jgi:LPXTG-motif cell wall-anchored protein
MVTSTYRNTARTNVAYGLLFSAVAMLALLFLGSGNAYAQSSGNTGSSSGGTAGTGTGDATATGNSSATAPTTVSGTGGTITIVEQQGTVRNRGSATAVSGENTTIGNNSRNLAVNGQDQPGGGGLNSNSGTATNNSTGSSSTVTGNATATGNASSTSLNQNINANATGTLGGILIVTQDATIDNVGRANAVSGGNLGIGNNSRNLAVNGQDLGRRPGTINNNAAAVTNSSGGNSLIDTGDSTATGNSATNSVSQVVNGSVGGSLGGIAVVDSNATVNNRGIATARSGGNVGIGNNSANLTVNSQRLGARGPPSIRTNDAPVTNLSDGNAAVITGNSTATGNSSSTNITQAVNITMAGGGFVISNQRAVINNVGRAAAISGDNRATGNASRNLAVNCQLINADVCFGRRGRPTGGAAGRRGNLNVVANFGNALNNSNGAAGINTGDSTASGNTSNDTVVQTTTANFGGTGFVIAEPVAVVLNRGDARAVSGGNVATGNNSRNLTVNCQIISSAPCVGRGRAAGATGGRRSARTTVPANFGQAINKSNGSASIVTGNSTAYGNKSATTIAQGVSSNIGGAIGGAAANDPILFSPRASVINRGTGFAGSGGNSAIGNNSRNLAFNCQVLWSAPCVSARRRGNVGGRGPSGLTTNVTSNFGSALNNSNGSADIITGNSWASGSESSTTVAQALNSTVNGSGFIVFDPVAVVRNRGVGRAVSGGNLAIGNGSANLAFNCQIISSGPCVLRVGRGRAGANGRRGLRVINANFGEAVNTSNGTASIDTGSSHALGNTATTSISQTLNASIPGFGFIFFEPTATLVNRGIGTAISGNNLATGNASRNLAVNCQLIGQNFCTIGSRGAGRINTLSTNNGTATNNSTGSASIITGCSCAVGNRTATAIRQGGNVDLGQFGTLFFDPDATLINTGDATATSGGNVTTGNDSANLALNRQRLGRRGGFAFNAGTANNTSGGDAYTETGDATAIGNMAATAICQGINGPLDCPVPPLPPLPDCFDKEHKDKPQAPGQPGVPGVPGEALPRTGAPLNVLAIAGVMLIALGALLRKKGQVTA